MTEGKQERWGTAVLAGRPNVGKSTLLNALTGRALSIVTPKAQTTRHRIEGLVSGPGFRMIVSDTPGAGAAGGSRLAHAMNREAEAALDNADCAILVVAAPRWTAGDDAVLGRLARTGLPDEAVGWLASRGLEPESLAVLAPLTLFGANSIGNVPLVVLLLSIMPAMSEGAFYALAVLSTLAGNLLVVGSLANIIAVERARDAGVPISFLEHAKCGVPMTLLSFLLALAWLALLGYARI